MSWQVVAFGILFPESLVRSQGFAVLAAFVAINTVVYVSLAVAKALPKIHVGDHLPRQYARAEYPQHPPGRSRLR